ncbi:MAG: helix-turn-helix domain-containing protein [Bacteroidales bacterium]|nr:helix-turn-helix domain-containing protein [Bacteroidales bacterium]
MENEQKDVRVEDSSQGNLRDFDGCYTTDSLAVRLNVSKKFVVSHRQRIPGAMKIGRIWRFDKATVERRLARGNLL